MEKKKSKISNYTIIGLTIIILVGILTYNVITKIIKERNIKLDRVLTNKITYYSKRCYLEEKCKSELTIQDLYNNGYISDELIDYTNNAVIDPLTKISVKNNEVTIYWDK